MCKYKFYICYLVILLLVFTSCSSTNNNIENQWAIKNYGQQIQKSKGTKNIDINIGAFYESIDESIIIALIDDGIDLNNEKITENISLNKNEITSNEFDDDDNGYIDDYYGWNFIDNNNQIQSNSSHGTSIFSILININDHQRVGVLKKANILPIKAIDGTGNVINIINAIKYAEKRGAKIVNCSWHLNKFDDDLYSIIKNSNMLFICAAGNEGSSDEVYPSGFNLPNIISVASINYDGVLSATSNYGKNIDVAAPGEKIYVLTNNGYDFVNGTSFTVPFVTSLCSILYNLNPNIDPVDVKKLVIDNVTKNVLLKDKIASEGIINFEKTINSIKQH